MPRQITCPHCRRVLKLPADLPAGDVRCAGCQAVFSVPGESADEGAAWSANPQVIPPPEKSADRFSDRTQHGRVTTSGRSPRHRDESEPPDQSTGGRWVPVASLVVGCLVAMVLAARITFAVFSIKPASVPLVQGRAGGPPGPPRQPAALPVPVGMPELPLPEPVVIRPAPISRETSIKLPEPAAAMRLGGGGRYLILHFPKGHALAIFDVILARIVRTVAVTADDIQFAAGMSHLVVCEPATKAVFRYSLETGALERQGQLDLPVGKMTAFCLGHASAGPLLVSCQQPTGTSQGRFFDLRTLAAIPLDAQEESLLHGTHYWAGATGRLFGTSESGKLATLRIDRAFLDRFDLNRNGAFVVPGPDDQHVYPVGFGVLNGVGGPDFSAAFTTLPNAPADDGRLFLPAAHGPYYLEAKTTPPNLFRMDLTAAGTIRLYRHGNKKPLATVTDTPLCPHGGEPAWAGLGGFGIEQSVQWIPKANLLVVVPPARDELRLYPANPERPPPPVRLRFLSEPSTTVQQGTIFRYAARVDATRPPLTFRLSDAPHGMSVGPTGQVFWDVPLNHREPVEVVLTVRDASGREVSQPIRLKPEIDESLAGRPPPPPVRGMANLTLPALPSPVPITPAPITERTAVRLSEAATGLCVGGGGRYLVLLLPKAKKLAVFDASAARIVREIAIPAEKVRLAVSMHHVLVYDGQQRQVHRYALETGAHEASGKLALPEGEIDSFCLGHASDGPLLVSVKDRESRLFDVRTLQRIHVPAFRFQERDPAWLQIQSGQYRAGPTGRQFGRLLGSAPSGFMVLNLATTGVTGNTQPRKRSYFVIPGVEERHVFAGGHGYLPNWTAVPWSRQPVEEPQPDRIDLPAVHGPFHVAVGTQRGRPALVRIHIAGDAEPFLKLDVPGLAQYPSEELAEFGFENSVHLIPQARLLVVVPESRQELQLIPADLDAALAGLQRDHAVFITDPPRTYQKGALWTYTPTASIEPGPVTFRLVSWPSGMTIDRTTGRIEWKVPADHATARCDVTVAARDGRGKEIVQRWTMTLDNRPPGPVSPLRP